MKPQNKQTMFYQVKKKFFQDQFSKLLYFSCHLYLFFKLFVSVLHILATGGRHKWYCAHGRTLPTGLWKPLGSQVTVV